ncbi:MAG: glycosyl hydrolase, partial [Caulobacteraceae bacterium]
MNLKLGRSWPAAVLRGVLIWVLLALALPAFAAGEGKRGLGLSSTAPFGDQIACLAQGLWYYNWSPTPTIARYRLQFVPMVRAKDDFDAVHASGAQRRYDTLLLFNEPNRANGKGIVATTPEFDSYTDAMVSHAATLVSPAPVHPFLPWFRDYMSSPQAQHDLGGVAIHWYGPADFAIFKAMVRQVEATYHKPVWLTEFAVIDRGRTFTQADVVRFLDQALPFLDSDPMVARYAWFGLRGNNGRPYKDSGFFADDGRLTPVGYRYLL